MPVCDPSLGEIVRRELNVDTIAHQDANSVAPHAARDRREDNMFRIVDLYFKESIRLLVHDDAC